MPQLAVGDTAPDFTLPTADGGTVTLSALRGHRVVIFFFPAAMTPGCTLEASDFQSVSPDLTDAGYQVIGISPDPVAKLALFAEMENLTYPLASDVDRTVLRAYGAWGEKKLYGKVLESVLRSTVVIDEEGRVAVAQYNVKATGHVGRLRRVLHVG
jgi:peroxiredoxin Q/BCP